MSEMAAAIFILPFLGILVLVLECGRMGCARLLKHMGVLRLERPGGLAQAQGEDY